MCQRRFGSEGPRKGVGQRCCSQRQMPISYLDVSDLPPLRRALQGHTSGRDGRAGRVVSVAAGEMSSEPVGVRMKLTKMNTRRVGSVGVVPGLGVQSRGPAHAGIEGSVRLEGIRDSISRGSYRVDSALVADSMLRMFGRVV